MQGLFTGLCAQFASTVSGTQSPTSLLVAARTLLLEVNPKAGIMSWKYMSTMRYGGTEDMEVGVAGR